MVVNELTCSRGLKMVRAVEGDIKDVGNCGEGWFEANLRIRTLGMDEHAKLIFNSTYFYIIVGI